MSVFYELGINWLVICEDIFEDEEWLHLISSFTTARQSVKLLSNIFQWWVVGSGDGAG